MSDSVACYCYLSCIITTLCQIFILKLRICELDTGSIDGLRILMCKINVGLLNIR